MLTVSSIGSIALSEQVLGETSSVSANILLLTSSSDILQFTSSTSESTLLLTAYSEEVGGVEYSLIHNLKLSSVLELQKQPEFTHSAQLKLASTCVTTGTFSSNNTLLLTSIATLGSGISCESVLKLSATSELVSGASLLHVQNLVLNSYSTFVVPTSILNEYGEEQVTAICVNLATGGHSTYTNFVFDKFVSVGNEYWAKTGTSEYKLTGTTDNGALINWKITYPKTDFNSDVKKNLQDVYVYLRSTGDTELVTYIDDEKKREGYVISYDSRDGLHRRRKLLPKGIIGTEWQLEVKSVDGSIAEINTVDIIAEKTQRVF
jgi:hypothetical protein